MYYDKYLFKINNYNNSDFAFNYKNYIDKVNNKFECLSGTDKCKNHDGKYSKTDVKECAENKEECLEGGYKIFNTFC